MVTGVAAEAATSAARVIGEDVLMGPLASSEEAAVASRVTGASDSGAANGSEPTGFDGSTARNVAGSTGSAADFTSTTWRRRPTTGAGDDDGEADGSALRAIAAVRPGPSGRVEVGAAAEWIGGARVSDAKPAGDGTPPASAGDATAVCSDRSGVATSVAVHRWTGPVSAGASASVGANEGAARGVV